MKPSRYTLVCTSVAAHTFRDRVLHDFSSACSATTSADMVSMGGKEKRDSIGWEEDLYCIGSMAMEYSFNLFVSAQNNAVGYTYPMGVESWKPTS